MYDGSTIYCPGKSPTQLANVEGDTRGDIVPETPKQTVSMGSHTGLTRRQLNTHFPHYTRWHRKGGGSASLSAREASRSMHEKKEVLPSRQCCTKRTTAEYQPLHQPVEVTAEIFVISLLQQRIYNTPPRADCLSTLCWGNKLINNSSRASPRTASAGYTKAHANGNSILSKYLTKKVLPLAPAEVLNLSLDYSTSAADAICFFPARYL